MKSMGRGDDREHHLEHREDVLGDPVGVVAVRRGADAVEEEEFAAPEDLAEEGAVEVLAEDQGVTHGPPEDGHHAGQAEALRDDGEHVLGANEAAVEEKEAGERHEEHQGGADHDEGVVARAGGSGDGTGRDLVVAGLGADVVDVGFQVGHALVERGSSRSRFGGRGRRGGCGCVLRGRQIRHCRQGEDGESS
jgi:hypothetical protein